MDFTATTKGVIAVLVAIIVVAVVAIPIVSDTTDNMLSADNEGDVRVDRQGVPYTFSSTPEDLSYVIETVKSYETYKINGIEVPDAVDTSYSFPVFFTDTFALWMTSNGLYYVAWTEPTSIPVALNDAQVTLSGGNLVATSDLPKTSYSKVYLRFEPDGSGDYRLFQNIDETAAYASPGSTIYLFGTFSFVNIDFGVLTLPDSPASHTTLEASFVGAGDRSPVENFPSMYLLSSDANGNYQFNQVRVDMSSYYTTVVAPLSYLGHPENQTNADLLKVVPLILIIAVLMMAVRLIAYIGRD